MRRPATWLLCIALAATGCERMQQRFAYDPKDFWVAPPPKTPLPDSAFRVRWNAHTVPPQLRANADVDVRLSLTNVSDQLWPGAVTADPEKRDGAYAVRLAYQWVPHGIAAAQKPADRVELPVPLAPGATSEFLVNLRAPAAPGDYDVVFELVQESVAWFDAKGGAKLVVPVRVTP